jgi:heat-inducible transcriptional repressor
VESVPEEWVRLAGTVLARLAQNLVMVTLPRAPKSRLRDVRLVAMQEFLAMLILILQEARLRHQVLGFTDAVSPEELEAIGHRLTNAYQGMDATEIESTSLELTATEQQIRQAILQLLEADEAAARQELYLDGLTAFLRQPEFAASVAANRLNAMMEIIESKLALQALITRIRSAEELQVIIGSENAQEELQEYTVVITPYGIPGEVQGTIGVLGPTRMSYPRVIASVAYLGSVMSELVREMTG